MKKDKDSLKEIIGLLNQIYDNRLYEVDSDKYPGICFFKDKDYLSLGTKEGWYSVIGFRLPDILVCYLKDDKNTLIDLKLDINTIQDMFLSFGLPEDKKMFYQLQEIIEFLTEQLHMPDKINLQSEIKYKMSDILSKENTESVYPFLKKVIQYRFETPIDTGIEVFSQFGNLSYHLLGFNNDLKILKSKGRGTWIAPDYYLEDVDNMSYTELLLLNNNLFKIIGESKK